MREVNESVNSSPESFERLVNTVKVKLSVLIIDLGKSKLFHDREDFKWKLRHINAPTAERR